IPPRPCPAESGRNRFTPPPYGAADGVRRARRRTGNLPVQHFIPGAFPMRLPSFLLSTALCLAAGATALQGQTTIPATDIPRTISYQGLLTSTDGVPFADGEYGITVTLYGDEQGTRPVWRQTCTTQVSGGIFNLYL